MEVFWDNLKFIYSWKSSKLASIVYKLAGSNFHSDDPTLKNCLFGVVTLTKNADIDKYGYSDYGTFYLFISRWWIWSKCINFWSRSIINRCR